MAIIISNQKNEEADEKGKKDRIFNIYGSDFPAAVKISSKQLFSRSHNEKEFNKTPHSYFFINPFWSFNFENFQIFLKFRFFFWSIKFDWFFSMSGPLERFTSPCKSPILAISPGFYSYFSKLG